MQITNGVGGLSTSAIKHDEEGFLQGRRLTVERDVSMDRLESVLSGIDLGLKSVDMGVRDSNGLLKQVVDALQSASKMDRAKAARRDRLGLASSRLGAVGVGESAPSRPASAKAARPMSVKVSEVSKGAPRLIITLPDHHGAPAARTPTLPSAEKVPHDMRELSRRLGGLSKVLGVRRDTVFNVPPAQVVVRPAAPGDINVTPAGAPRAMTPRAELTRHQAVEPSQAQGGVPRRIDADRAELPFAAQLAAPAHPVQPGQQDRPVRPAPADEAPKVRDRSGRFVRALQPGAPSAVEPGKRSAFDRTDKNNPSLIGKLTDAIKGAQGDGSDTVKQIVEGDPLVKAMQEISAPLTGAAKIGARMADRLRGNKDAAAPDTVRSAPAAPAAPPIREASAAAPGALQKASSPVTPFARKVTAERANHPVALSRPAHDVMPPAATGRHTSASPAHVLVASTKPAEVNVTISQRAAPSQPSQPPRQSTAALEHRVAAVESAVHAALPPAAPAPRAAGHATAPTGTGAGHQAQAARTTSRSIIPAAPAHHAPVEPGVTGKAAPSPVSPAGMLSRPAPKAKSAGQPEPSRSGEKLVAGLSTLTRIERRSNNEIVSTLKDISHKPGGGGGGGKGMFGSLLAGLGGLLMKLPMMLLGPLLGLLPKSIGGLLSKLIPGAAGVLGGRRGSAGPAGAPASGTAKPGSPAKTAKTERAAPAAPGGAPPGGRPSTAESGPAKSKPGLFRRAAAGARRAASRVPILGRLLGPAADVAASASAGGAAATKPGLFQRAAAGARGVMAKVPGLGRLFGAGPAAGAGAGAVAPSLASAAAGAAESAGAVASKPGILGRMAGGAGRGAKGLLKRLPIIGGLFAAAELAQAATTPDDPSATPEQNRDAKVAAVGRVGGGLAGGAAGAAAGGAIGAFLGPPGALVGSIVGGVIGAFGGEAVGEKFAKVVDGLSAADIPRLFTDMADKVKSAITGIPGVLGGMVDKVKSTMSDIWGAIKDSPLGTAYEQAKEKVKAVVDKAQQLGSDAVDKAKEIAKLAADKAKELGGGLIEKGRQAMSAGADMVTAVKDKVVKATGATVQAAKDGYSDARNASTVAPAGARVVSPSTGATTTAGAGTPAGPKPAKPQSAVPKRGMVESAGYAVGAAAGTAVEAASSTKDNIAKFFSGKKDGNKRRAAENASLWSQGNIKGLDENQTKALVATTLETESGGGRLDVVNSLGYMGKYQAGAAWLAGAGMIRGGGDAVTAAKNSDGFKGKSDTAWAKSGGMTRFLSDDKNWIDGMSRDKYLSSHDAQDQAFRNATNANYDTLVRMRVINSDTPPEKVAGLLKASHLSGPNEARKVSLGKVGASDSNGTSAAKYYNDAAADPSKYRQIFSRPNNDALALVKTSASAQTPASPVTPATPSASSAPPRPAATPALPSIPRVAIPATPAPMARIPDVPEIKMPDMPLNSRCMSR